MNNDERMKLIQETVDCIRNTFNRDTESDKLVRNCMSLVQNAIDGEYHDMEEVDVSKIERPHGKWITHQTSYFLWEECDQCGAQVGTVGMRYCPNCGAKMGVEENECI